jgi:hypothetical protein
MDFDTSEDHEPDLTIGARQSLRRMFRAVFYFACSTIILAAILVALVSASAPPPGDTRIVVIDSAGTRLPSDDTIKALRQACARERITTLPAASMPWS